MATTDEEGGFFAFGDSADTLRSLVVEDDGLRIPALRPISEARIANILPRPSVWRRLWWRVTDLVMGWLSK